MTSSKMSSERVMKILLAPHITEKGAIIGESSNQYVFRVATDATKPEIKQAVEQLFDVSVNDVQVLNNKGKTKRTNYGLGKRKDWKKAYVRVHAGQSIEFAGSE